MWQELYATDTKLTSSRGFVSALRHVFQFELILCNSNSFFCSSSNCFLHHRSHGDNSRLLPGERGNDKYRFAFNYFSEQKATGMNTVLGEREIHLRARIHGAPFSKSARTSKPRDLSMFPGIHRSKRLWVRVSKIWPWDRSKSTSARFLPLLPSFPVDRPRSFGRPWLT